MSYCHLQSVGINFVPGFGTQPGNVIRNSVNNANCLQALISGPDVITYPPGVADYSIPSGFSVLQWEVTSGLNIISGQGTNSINVAYDGSYSGGASVKVAVAGSHSLPISSGFVTKNIILNSSSYKGMKVANYNVTQDQSSRLVTVSLKTSSKVSEVQVPYSLYSLTSGTLVINGQISASGGILNFTVLQAGLYVLKISIGKWEEEYRLILR